MDFKLNFLGVYVNDFGSSFRFYTETLGMVALDSRVNWALFDTTGMTLELFGNGSHRGGECQVIFPGLRVSDVSGLIDILKAKGVALGHTIRMADGTTSGGIIAPEGLLWLLEDGPRLRVGPSLSKPHISGVRLDTTLDGLNSHRAFYEKTMGLRVDNSGSDWILFGQGEGAPELFILGHQEGGKKRPPISSRREAPHYLSFETRDIERAAEWLHSHSVRIIQDVTRQDWGGIDIHALDADGNPVQIVQYPERAGR